MRVDGADQHVAFVSPSLGERGTGSSLGGLVLDRPGAAQKALQADDWKAGNMLGEGSTDTQRLNLPMSPPEQQAGADGDVVAGEWTPEAVELADAWAPRTGVPYKAMWGYREPAVAARYHRRRYRRMAGLLRTLFVGRAVRRALRGVAVRSGLVVDFPCGTGVASRALVRAGARVVAADVSIEMLRFARTISGPEPAISWVCADIEWPPLRAQAVAAVVCLRFFAHLPSSRWTPVLQTLGRLTSGPIIIGLPMRYSSKHRWRAFKRWLGMKAKQRPIFPMETVTAALEQAGLELQDRLWQSPFTDTALVIARRGRPDAEQLAQDDPSPRTWGDPQATRRFVGPVGREIW